MLDEEILALCESAPLSPERAAELVGAYPGVADYDNVNCAFSRCDGRARGTFYGQGDLSGAWVCAVGAFDGFHLGHQALIARARKEAEALGARVCAVTFSPDPSEVLGSPAPASRLMDTRHRAELLLRGGADGVLEFEFDEAFSALTYDEFVREALLKLVDARAIVVGSDFCMGAHGAGTVDALRALGHELSVEVIGLDLLGEDGAPVTATRIRGLVRKGSVEAAAGLMGRCPAFTGHVERGRGEGTSFGFPTANVITDMHNCLPEQGVYAGFVTPLGEYPLYAYPAAINVGLPPTFLWEDSDLDLTAVSFLEANLIGYEGDLYGSDVAVTLIRWLRDSRPFDSLEELKRTVLGNIDWVRGCLGDAGVHIDEGEVER
ncbi:bifunctional riboflavin kinase/FMN adenylyltransferase [Paratractidigestivibacter sp.]|uniref:bifunctional riboflavin kinase/FMN adenylyltransferase n=1 Tax=Paratractidigestivibacter sp. TaxID=2847316 RepID=UPI002AC99996|nr:riboflavin kinase [Paratractidigestivibacter sp.]